MLFANLFILPTIASPLPEPFAIPPPHPNSVTLRHSESSIARSIDAELSTRSLESRSSLDETWLLREAAKVDSRYNAGDSGFGALYAASLHRKRAGQVSLTDHNLDASYSGSVSVGTPSQTFDVVLDTGSSDFWVASSSCSNCNVAGKFTTSQSSSWSASNKAFSIQYGSGTASGTIGKDTVTLGGYTVQSQTMAACNQVGTGLIPSSVSGIMGLAWQALSYSDSTPWWISLASSGAWSQPLFGFYLKRYRDVSGASTNEYDGGQATLGYLDNSLYSGSITYISLSADAQYWSIPMDSMTMQGTNINIASSSMVAVDTGTTLIGGPASAIAAIYAAIPGAQQMSGSYANYYQYPCTTSITFTLTFGGFPITITNADFNLGRYSNDQTMCTGAAFIQNLPSSSPVQWIVGDTALKNVYSVYRYSPAAVGFASLPGNNAATNGAAAIPSALTLTQSVAVLTGNVASPSPSASSNSTKASATQSGLVVTATAYVTASTTSNSAIQAQSSKSAALSLKSGGWWIILTALGVYLGY